MNNSRYVWAAARIRVLESSLLSREELERLAGCRTYEEGLEFLAQRGWDGADTAWGEAMLAARRAKNRELMKSLRADKEVLGVLLRKDEFHNLKAAVKAVCSGERPGIFMESGAVSGEALMEIVRNREFGKLPEAMGGAAEEAYQAMLRYRDGQLCDVILDRAALEAIRREGEASRVGAVKIYARMTVENASLRTALRAARAGKGEAFLKRALPSSVKQGKKRTGWAESFLKEEAGGITRALDGDRLCRTAAAGEKTLWKYLEETGWGEAVRKFRQSGEVFDRWCDNRLIRALRPWRMDSFSPGPLLVYAAAQENELKNVRMILAGKKNGFSEEKIRERIRETYG